MAGILLFAMAPNASAQETTGGIKAFVKDKTGAVIPKASVQLSGPALITPRTLVADDAGYVFFQLVPPGEYTLSASAPNFRAVKVTGIKLSVGKLPTFDLLLELGEISQTIEVTSSAVLIDVTASNVSTAIPEDVIANVPKGRSYQTLIPFAPGARQEPLQSSGRYDRGRQNGFQIDGASDSENTYLIEGLDSSEIQNGGIKQNVVFEFVQEVQVKTSGMTAEYGGATGGVVNVIQKRGSNQWHGGLVTYYRTNAFDSNDPCLATPNPSSEQITALIPPLTQRYCGLRQIPGTSINFGSPGSPRGDAPAEYYKEKQDQYRIAEPGFELGGPILKDKLWIFSSYIPTIDRTSRTVNFTGATSPGLHTFYRSNTVQNMLNRLDYQPFSKLHLFAGWQYGYSRVAGQFPALPDSVISSQVNSNSAGTNPANYRPDRGSVNPSNTFNFGGDWTINSHAVVTARYGDFYYNTSDRGLPTGIRYVYNTNLVRGDQSASPTQDIYGNPLIPSASSPGASFAYTNGSNNSFSNIDSNQQVLFDVFTRKAFSSDLSYSVSKWGTHNFKVGYGLNKLFNNVVLGYNTSLINIFWGGVFTPTAGANNCAAIEAQNVTTFPNASGDGTCRGNAGYFTVSDGVDTAGKASSTNHGIYFLDGWTLGKGLTLNLSVRLDKEYLPSYAAGYPSINFGFGSKVAPRIGGAYDVFHNGKLKVFAEYSKVYDIMKFSLPRGSFGGEYWHDCTYAMDFIDYTTITPTAPGGHACGPTQDPSAGVTVGRFIQNKNWRAAVPPSTVDPGIDPNIKPMSQHEIVGGADWAITPNLGLEVRYARKRLDKAIEDMSVDDNTYYIGNPGSPFSDLLHRPIPSAFDPATTTPPIPPDGLCATCPHQPPATRRYDAIETRLQYRHGSKLFGQISYTYSKLRGNYPGLVDSDISDGDGGRHSPNNSRLFDITQMQYTTSGKVEDGPLSTDRPHVLSMTGYYQLKWWHMSTTLGATQVVGSGTPKSTCVPVIDSTSSCQYWGDQRGTFANIHRDSTTGDLVLDSVTTGARNPVYSQTDFNFGHEIGVSKSNEAMKLGFEWTVTNLFNQASILSYNPNPFAIVGGSEFLNFAVPASVNPGLTDFKAAMSGYDPIAVGNAQDAAGAGPIVYNNRYGLPFLFQSRRTMRMAIRFTF